VPINHLRRSGSRKRRISGAGVNGLKKNLHPFGEGNYKEDYRNLRKIELLPIWAIFMPRAWCQIRNDVKSREIKWTHLTGRAL
jgi:hypothetical protein